MVFFCQKKFRHLKSKISTKFHRLLFRFQFFSIFCILFSVSPFQTCPKLWNFLSCFFRRVRDFTNDFWKILKVFLNKIQICELIFFSKFCGLLFVFYFLLFLTFYFQFPLSVLVKKLLKFLCFFILRITDFVKKFWKIMEYFSKKVQTFEI